MGQELKSLGKSAFMGESGVVTNLPILSPSGDGGCIWGRGTGPPCCSHFQIPC